MAQKASAAPDNYFGIKDLALLEEMAGELSARRLFELENGPLLTEFTRESLQSTHLYLMQDIYPWAGKIRTEEVGAMGIAMCRARYVEAELDRVMGRIAKLPVSSDDKSAAVNTIADHWSELTIVHPFRDGNSRTQRFFFDQMLRTSGWAVDWTRIDAAEAHAARYVGAATADPSFLAEVLTPGVFALDALPDNTGTLSATQGQRAGAAEIFHQMMEYRRTNPGAPWRAR
ncbi:Fic/DOC family protein [Corynebacterium coyleae]